MPHPLVTYVLLRLEYQENGLLSCLAILDAIDPGKTKN